MEKLVFARFTVMSDEPAAVTYWGTAPPPVTPATATKGFPKASVAVMVYWVPPDTDVHWYNP